MVHSAKAGAGGPLRLGVVGVGVMGANHARVLADLADVKLVGIADSDRKQRDLVANALGCTGHADVEALIASGVDAITIAAPTHLHRDLALTCIRHGVHILVEKPIASSVEEGRAIIAAAQRAGVTLMVGHVERFNPAVEAIKTAIRDEDILSIAITRVGPFPPRMSNVGVVIDLGGARHRSDPLVHRFRHRGGPAATLQRHRGARGHRAAAVPHRFGRARAHQHQLAHALQGAQRHRGDPEEIHHGRPADPPGDRVFRLPARRQLFDASPLGRPCRAVARRAAGLRRRDPVTASARR